MRVIWILFLVACQRGHDVRILLGPTEDSLSIGFLCLDSTGRELIRQAQIPGNPPTFQLAIVVDLMTIGGRVLGCRGEELITACEGGTCSLETRACQVVTLEFTSTPTEADLHDAVREALAGFTVIDDAPDEPVVLRVVAADLLAPLSPGTKECPAELLDRTFDLEPRALGCAYSCPVELDNVDQVSVSLDTLSRQCEPAMRVCAGFLK